jgi:hypothetical protein
VLVREFSEQLHRQIEKQIEDLVTPSPLLASMRAQIEDVVSPSPLRASILARIKHVQRSEDEIRRCGIRFPKELQIEEAAR